jgi:hypothetical protein
MLGLVIDEHAVRLVCRSIEGSPGGALVELDPKAGAARARWPFPESLPHERSEGLALFADGGRFGFVYRVAESQGLAVGIGDAEGWELAPRAVPVAPDSELLGVAWVDGALELVTGLRERNDLVGVAVSRLTSEGLEQIAPRSPSQDLCTGREQPCEALAAQWTPAGGWSLLYRAWAVPSGPALLEAPLVGGERRVLRAGGETLFELRRQVDLTAAGVLGADSVRRRWRLNAGGELEELGDRGARGARFPTYAIAGGELRLEEVERVPGVALRRTVDATDVIVGLIGPGPLPLAVLVRVGDAPARVIGVVPAACRDLEPDGFVLEGSAGALTLVSPSGCWLALENSGRPLD